MSIFETLVLTVVKNTDGCWIWSGLKNPCGYGRTTYKNKQYLAHRLMFEVYNNIVPGKLCVLHKCDTPACINPEHLFLGTRAENMADMRAKGRGHKKVSDVDVLRIRALNLRGFSQRHLVEKFGMSKSYISRIINGKLRDNI